MYSILRFKGNLCFLYLKASYTIFACGGNVQLKIDNGQLLDFTISL